jgi:transcriptional regulator with XRE-family HTH domain
MPINREWLEERMLDLGISVNALKKKHHIAPSTINSWDEGAVNPRPDTLRRLADALQVQYLDLIRYLRVTPGDFTEVGQKLTEARLKKERRRVKA